MMEELPAAEALAVVSACERLNLDYSHHADSGRMDEWAQLFAEDGELIFFGQTHSGRVAIKAAGGTDVTLHVITNIRIEPLSADEAQGTAYVTTYVNPADGAAGGVTPVAVGTYDDRYRRTPEGWRFARRTFEPFARATA